MSFEMSKADQTDQANQGDEADVQEQLMHDFDDDDVQALRSASYDEII